MDAAQVADALRAGHTVGVSVDGHDHQLGPDDLQLVMQPLEGYQVERAGSHAVALELELDDALRREGLARAVIHAVQAARKDAGLDVSDRIELALGGDDAILAAAREHEAVIAGEVLATSFTVGDGAAGATAEVDGHALSIALRKA
jgi:isoleucyl-tRNA synthetase